MKFLDEDEKRELRSHLKEYLVESGLARPEQIERGQNFSCPGMDHNDDSPSAHYYDDPNCPHVYCFGCGESWDLFKLIADSYPSERTHRMAPIRGDIPGEEIFRRIEHALDAEGENSCNFNLRDALRNFENLPAQEALISLKRAANTRDKQEECSVLHGTMKYETRQDRKKAYQWARKSMNQSAWDLGEKIYYDELDLKRSKEQGRI